MGYTSFNFRFIYGNSLYTKTDGNNITPLYNDHSIIEANIHKEMNADKKTPCYCDQTTSE